MTIEQGRTPELVAPPQLPVVDANPELPTAQFKKELKKALTDIKQWRAPGFKLTNLFDPSSALRTSEALRKSNFGFEEIFARAFVDVFKPTDLSMRDSFPNVQHIGYRDKGLHFDKDGSVNCDYLIMRLHLLVEGKVQGYFTNTPSKKFIDAVDRLDEASSAKVRRQFNISEAKVSVGPTATYDFGENPGEGVVFVSEGIVGKHLVIPSTQHNFISATRERRYAIREVTLFWE